MKITRQTLKEIEKQVLESIYSTKDSFIRVIEEEYGFRVYFTMLIEGKMHYIKCYYRDFYEDINDTITLYTIDLEHFDYDKDIIEE